MNKNIEVAIEQSLTFAQEELGWQHSNEEWETLKNDLVKAIERELTRTRL